MKSLITLLIVLSLHTAAHAQTDGHALLAKCEKTAKFYSNSSPVGMEDGLCLGLIRGIKYTMQVWNVTDPKPTKPLPFRSCIPKGVSNEESVNIVLKYLRAHPKKLELDEEALIIEAFADAYPCK